MGSLLRKANELIEQYGSVENYLKAMEIEGKLRPIVKIPEVKNEEILYFPDPEVIEAPRMFNREKDLPKRKHQSIYFVSAADLEIHLDKFII